MAKAENKHFWGMKTAARLRAVHANLPDSSPEDRLDRLMSEIDAWLDDAHPFPGETRQSLLEALLDYFPVFDEADSTARSGAAASLAAPAATRPAEWTTEDLLDELGRRSGQLSEAQMKRLAELLPAPAGQPGRGSALPPGIVEAIAFPGSQAERAELEKGITQLWKELGVPEEFRGTMKLYRVVKMLGILAAAYRDIHVAVWVFWENAPAETRGRIRPSLARPLGEAIGSLVTGGEVGGGPFDKEVKNTKCLVSASLKAMIEGTKVYAESHAAEISQDRVESEVRDDEKARGREFERKCWARYCEIAARQTQQNIQDQILLAVMNATLTRYQKST